MGKRSKRLISEKEGKKKTNPGEKFTNKMDGSALAKKSI